MWGPDHDPRADEADGPTVLVRGSGWAACVGRYRDCRYVILMASCRFWIHGTWPLCRKVGSDAKEVVVTQFVVGDVDVAARSPAGQGSEAVLGCEILNRMTALGRPVSSRIGT